MPTVEEKIVLAREARDKAEAEFRKALRAGRRHGMSWSRLATVAGMSNYGVRYLTDDYNKKRRAPQKKGENGGS
jgi:hypothetical protein